MQQRYEQGLVNPLVVMTIVLGVLVVGLSGFGLWSFINYQDQKNNVDAKIEAAVADAKRAQREEDEKLFAEREKQPVRQLIGPEDLGRVSLDYPKTWSVFVEKSDNSGYEAYLHPGAVPPLNSKTPHALRVTTQDRPYDQVLKEYQDAVKKGELKATPIAVEGLNGTRLDGNFSKEIQGSMVIFKVRDKTLRVYTESRTFQPDFDNIIIKSLKFNP
ncbi:MAG: hypothetical protein ACREGJ_00695 [Candidatus Saccharimonadales bacterium]